MILADLSLIDCPEECSGVGVSLLDPSAAVCDPAEDLPLLVLGHAEEVHLLADELG